MRRGNGIVILFLILLIIIAGVSVAYFAITANDERVYNEELESQVKQLKEEINKVKANANSIVDNESSTQSVPNNVTVNENSNVNKAIVLNKCLNATAENARYSIEKLTLADYESVCDYTAVEAYVKISEQMAKNYYDYKVKVNFQNKVEGLNQRIVDVIFAGYGQDITHSVLLFLLEDGTVNYLTFEDMVINNNFTTKKFDDVTGIVKIAKGITERRMAPLLIKADGSFYDAGELLK